MPRSHGRIMATIWNDPDFLALGEGAQRLYLFILSQPDLSHAGLVPMRVKRWSGKFAGGRVDLIWDRLSDLEVARFVVTDEDTEELLVRTFVRNDGVYKQPKVMLRLREDAKQIDSPRLRATFRAELDRLPLHELSTSPSGRNGDGPSTYEAVRDVVDTLSDDFSDVADNPSERVSDGVSDTPRVRAGALHLPPTPVPQPPAPSTSGAADADADAPSKSLAVVSEDRPDVERVCNHLADRIEANGSKRPTTGKGWHDAARLMLDRDKRAEADIHAAIDWCQDHDFWRANILSLPKLREKYDQLRLQAQAAGHRPARQQQTDDLFGRALQRAQDRDRSQP